VTGGCAGRTFSAVVRLAFASAAIPNTRVVSEFSSTFYTVKSRATRNEFGALEQFIECQNVDSAGFLSKQLEGVAHDLSV